MGLPILIADPREMEWAKRYGHRIEGEDGGAMVGYQWGNHIYITDETVVSGEQRTS